MITTKKTKNKWGDEETVIDEGLIKLCKTEGIQVYTTVSESKAAITERTLRSLEKIF